MDHVPYVMGFGLFQMWMYGFITTFMTHSFWFGYAFALVITHTVLFPADHSQDSPELLMWIEVWLTALYPAGALTALVAIDRFKIPRLWKPNALSHDGLTSMFTKASVGAFIYICSWYGLFLGINYAALRFTTTGMSPIGAPDEANSILYGVIIIVVSVALIVISTLWLSLPAFGRVTAETAMTAKYMWITTFIIWSGFIHDILAPRLGRPFPGLLQLLTQIVLLFLAAIASNNIGLKRFKGDDPLFKNKLSWTFFLVLGSLLIGANVCGWVTNLLTEADWSSITIVLYFYSVIASVIVWIISYFWNIRKASKQVEYQDLETMRQTVSGIMGNK